VFKIIQSRISEERSEHGVRVCNQNSLTHFLVTEDDGASGKRSDSNQRQFQEDEDEDV
jgi:hypothetical protein